jgi:hypothetical protein
MNPAMTPQIVRYGPWESIGKICHLLTLGLIQKAPEATTTRVPSLVATKVAQVSGGLVPIVIVASLAPKATGLAAIVVISTAEFIIAAVLVSHRARVVATAAIILVGAVVVVVTVARARAPASTIVVIGIVVVRHCAGFKLEFRTEEVFK